MLQEEAERIRAEEVAGVVERIKEAISAYGLTLVDLFGKSAGVAKSADFARRSKPPEGAKFSDGKGGEWGGRGPRPLWLREALAAGHSLEEFAVVAPIEGTSRRSGEAVSPRIVKRRSVSYRDPVTGKIWTGFGRQPAWLKKALAEGQALESIQVD